MAAQMADELVVLQVDLSVELRVGSMVDSKAVYWVLR